MFIISGTETDQGVVLLLEVLIKLPHAESATDELIVQALNISDLDNTIRVSPVKVKLISNADTSNCKRRKAVL